MDVSDKVMKAAQSDYTMRCRLAGVSDLVAADARYHLKYYVKFLRKHSCDSTLAKENGLHLVTVHPCRKKLGTGKCICQQSNKCSHGLDFMTM